MNRLGYGLEMMGALGDDQQFGLDWNSEECYLGAVLTYAISSNWSVRLEPAFGLSGVTDSFMQRPGVAYMFMPCSPGAMDRPMGTIKDWTALSSAPSLVCALRGKVRWLSESDLVLHTAARAASSAIFKTFALTSDRPEPFVWTKTTEEILACAARLNRAVRRGDCNASKERI